MRHATLLTLAAAALVLAPRAEAQCTGTEGTDFQRVTVREINAIPQANIDQLNTNAATLTTSDIWTLLTNDLEGELVEFTAVLLSDPFKSGLRSLNAAGIPGGIHTFVRDTTAQSAGLAGMGVQVVDGTGTGLMQRFFVGDEITICGFVNVFPETPGNGKAIQVSPLENGITATGTVYQPTDAIMQPIVVTTDDVHDIVAGQTQLDWDSYSDYNGQYVRFEGIELIQGVPGARPDMLLSSVGQDTQINSYDTSLRYRNDRAGAYPNPPYATRASGDDFVPPAVGIVNIQGFLTYQGDDGNFNYAIPDPANFVIVPFEDADFEITQAPPIVSIDALTTIPGPSDAVTITASVTSSQSTVASVVLDYTFESTGATGQVTLANTSGDTYSGDIPAGPNGSFVTFTVTATDNSGLKTTSNTQGYLVFTGDINAISLVQTTFDGRPGDSPLLTGSAASFDLTALVQDVIVRGSTTYAVLQDNAALEPFTGVLARVDGVNVGDEINITEATINENFGQTELRDLTFTITSSGNALYGYKEVTTSLFTGADAQANLEAHEGMLLRFNSVTISDVNADGDDTSEGFGEFEFTTGTGEMRVDDYDDDIPQDFNITNLMLGQTRDFIRGVLAYSFSNYKLFPSRLADLGSVTNVATADGPEASTVRIVGAFPNPATGAARIRFELAAPATVALRMYDVTGREVATIAEGAFSADAHEVTADFGGLSAGVYVLRLEADGAVATARLAVVR